MSQEAKLQKINGLISFTKIPGGATNAYTLVVRFGGREQRFGIEHSSDNEALDLLIESVDQAKKDPRRYESGKAP